MPILNLKDLDNVETIVTTYYKLMLDEFNEKIRIEEKKYALNDREKIFVETIRELLRKLDEVCRYR